MEEALVFVVCALVPERGGVELAACVRLSRGVCTVTTCGCGFHVFPVKEY